ncbi:MAG: Single-stranded DNA-binding protein, partial [Candidatus Woesebacteria bacterium GW2011_GWA1_37_8]
RLQTRKWTGQDSVEHTTTEIVISDMLILDSRSSSGESDFNVPDDLGGDLPDGLGEAETSADAKAEKEPKKQEKSKREEKSQEDDDIPF